MSNEGTAQVRPDLYRLTKIVNLTKLDAGRPDWRPYLFFNPFTIFATVPERTTPMKISTKGTSRFLSQADIPAPFTVIIQDVRVENLKSNRGDESKYILYFTAGKPMVFNVVNRKTLVASYGNDSANWIGKPIEIYVDPNVWMGSQQTGGIRVRVPAQAPLGTTRLVAATALPAASVPAPALNLSQTPPPELTRFDNGNGKLLTLAELSATLVAGFDAAQDKINLDQWTKWGRQYPFTEKQSDLHEDRYNVALDRFVETAAIARNTSRPVEMPE